MAPLATEAPPSYDDLMRPPRGCLLFTKGLTVVLNVISIIILFREHGLEDDDKTYRRICLLLISISTVTTFAQMTIACCGCSDRECKTCLVIIEKINVALLSSCTGVGYTYTKSWPTIILFSWASNELGVPILKDLCD